MLETARPGKPGNSPHDVIRNVVAGAFHWHFGDFCPTDSWSPPCNVYQVAGGIDVCVSLAGVQRDTIDVRVEPGRLTVRGQREAPKPPTGANPQRILVMEIEHGTFCREISLPLDVDLSRVGSTFEQGLLWIHLPLRQQA